ncbi:MAG: S8 family serine peptidase [Planctomycetota bacterium]
MILALTVGLLIARGEQAAEMAAAQRTLFAKLHVAEAWEYTRGDPTVSIGVIDNGFDYYHPSLKGRLEPGYYYPGGYHSDFYENIAHGTLVAGIIVANGDDGVSGLAPDCRIITASQGTIDHYLVKLQKRTDPKLLQSEMAAHPDELKRFGEAWSRYQVEGAAHAIDYLVDRGVRVINFSGGLWRSQCPSAAAWQKLEDAVRRAAEHDVIVVLSAGNNAKESTDYPGSHANVIVAGGITLDDKRWDQSIPYNGTIIKVGSNYGARLSVMAPIENIVSCEPHERGCYQTDDGPMGATRVEFHGNHSILPNGGTSSAAPIVAALVALVRSARPDLDAAAVIDIIERGCDDLGASGRDPDTGFGRVNFGKTLALAVDDER